MDKEVSGYGVPELLLRYIAYCCTSGRFAASSRVCIVTGPRIDLAEDLIARFKGLFVRVLHGKKELDDGEKGC